MARILREYNKINTLLKEYPDIKSIQPIDDNLIHWKAIFKGPLKSPFEGHLLTLHITLTPNYPYESPKVTFPSYTIAHPNVKFSSGEICLDILKDKWSPVYGLIYIIESIKILLSEPNTDSPLDVDLSRLYDSDRECYNDLINYRLKFRQQEPQYTDTIETKSIKT